MTTKDAIAYAMKRGRVISASTSMVGNLVDWLPGQYCKVFTGYQLIGAAKLPKFETWLKAETFQCPNDDKIGEVKVTR